MRRRTLLRSLAGTALVLAGCNEDKTNANASESSVTLALNWVPEPEFGGFYAARESGAFRREKLEVDIRGGGAGVPVVQMVATGKAEFGIAGADEVLMARAQGADVVALFATYQTSPQAIMTHASRGAKQLGDVLASGLLALEPGLPYAKFLQRKYGTFGAKVVPYDGGVAHFLADATFSQQCYVTSEPIAARKKGSDPQVFLIADDGFNPYVGIVITRRSFAEQHADVVRRFASAIRAGWAAYLNDPGPTNALMQSLNTSMDAETFQAAAAAQKPLIEGGDAASSGVGTMTKERWQSLATELVALGLLKSAPEIDFLVSAR
jgi:NitT/TauT family transport system substrate-binding protein